MAVTDVIDPSVFKTGTDYATNAATNAYNNAKLRLESEQEAFKEAQTAYENALSIATTFGTSPGGTYNGMQLPAAGTPTMGQAAQWASLYGSAVAPQWAAQPTLNAQQQWFNQAQQAQQQAAGLSGYYTPQGAGTISQGANIGQINQALQNALGGNFNQNLFQQMTNGLQGANMSTPQAMQAVNNAIQASTGGRMTSYADIAGAVGAMSGGTGYGETPGALPTMQMQAQQAGLTGMTQYMPYAAGTWLVDPQTGQYGVINANGQIRNFTDFQSAKAAGMPTADWAGGNQADPARTVQTSSANNWGGIGGQMPTMAYQQQMFNQAMDTAKFQQSTAQSYLDLLSKMQGPADYGQYLKVLGSTPSGIQGLTAAAAGQYVPGAGATTGQQPTAQTLGNFVNSATSGAAQGGASPYDVARAAGSGTAGGQMNPQWMTQPTAAQAPGSAPYGTGGSTSYQQFMNAAQNLPAPNQLSPQALNAMTPSQRSILQSMYGQLGYNSDDVSALFNQSLPKYAAGQGVATGSFNLR